jgi:hypothetical protein
VLVCCKRSSFLILIYFSGKVLHYVDEIASCYFRISAENRHRRASRTCGALNHIENASVLFKHVIIFQASESTAFKILVLSKHSSGDSLK